MRSESYLGELVRDEAQPKLRYLGFVGHFIRDKIPKIMIILALYAGAKHHSLIGRVEDFVLRENVKVEQGYFQDPRGLEVKVETNEKGNREVYLYHEDTKTKIPIPDNLKGLESRLRAYSRPPKR